MDRFSSCAIDYYQQYINYLIAHFLYFSLFLSTSCCIPRLLYLGVFYLAVCFCSSFSIFHLYTLFPVLSLPRFPAALAWRGFFFYSSSLHNCLDKFYIDCLCRLQLILLFTVFSFLLGSSWCDEHFSASIHQHVIFFMFFTHRDRSIVHCVSPIKLINKHTEK